MAETVEIDGKVFTLGQIMPGHRTVIKTFESDVAPDDMGGHDRLWFWARYGCSADCWYLRRV